MDSEYCSKCHKTLGPEERLLHALYGGLYYDDELPKCNECHIEDQTAKCSICGESTKLMKNGTPLCARHMER